MQRALSYQDQVILPGPGCQAKPNYQASWTRHQANATQAPGPCLRDTRAYHPGTQAGLGLGVAGEQARQAWALGLGPGPWACSGSRLRGWVEG